jgi:hypothetical protein
MLRSLHPKAYTTELTLVNGRRERARKLERYPGKLSRRGSGCVVGTLAYRRRNRRKKPGAGQLPARFVCDPKLRDEVVDQFLAGLEAICSFSN